MKWASWFMSVGRFLLERLGIAASWHIRYSLASPAGFKLTHYQAIHQRLQPRGELAISTMDSESRLSRLLGKRYARKRHSAASS